MDYGKTTKLLERYLEQLNSCRQALQDAEESIISIERQVSDIDRTLPDADSLYGEQREQALRMYELTDRIFTIIDETLGPPQDGATGAPSGTAYMPEARGNGNEVSLYDLLSPVKKPRTS